jgi:hypothetical protein
LADNRRCSTCGEPNRGLARFCRNCGSSFETSSAQESTDRSLGAGPEPVSRDIDAAQSGYGYGPPPRASREWPLRLPVAVLLAIALLGGTLAVVGWRVHWPHALFGGRRAAAVQHLPTLPGGTPVPHAPGSGASSSPPISSSAGSPGPTASPGPAPATVVQEYFAAINQGKYAKAWRLGGSNFSPSYAAFVAGFQGTVNDVVTIVSARGRVVTAHLAALQADGTTKVYDGTYTVINGAIARSSVHQVS